MRLPRVAAATQQPSVATQRTVDGPSAARKRHLSGPAKTRQGCRQHLGALEVCTYAFCVPCSSDCRVVQRGCFFARH
eukprot:1284213-Alexandrium_andersonii.AAC.1